MCLSPNWVDNSHVPFTFLSFTFCIFCLILLAQCSKHYFQQSYFVSGVGTSRRTSEKLTRQNFNVINRYREFEHWKALIEENKTYTLYNCHVFDNDIAFKPVDHPFKVVFGSGTKVEMDDKLTNIPTHEFRFKSFKEIQDGKFKTDVLYGIVMCFNLFLCFL